MVVSYCPSLYIHDTTQSQYSTAISGDKPPQYIEINAAAVNLGRFNGTQFLLYPTFNQIFFTVPEAMDPCSRELGPQV